jgi:hypothetical protein
VLRLSRLRVISDIEFIINSPSPALGQRKWTSKGAECSVDRHSFAGEVYSFHVDILQVHLAATGSPKMEAAHHRRILAKRRKREHSLYEMAQALARQTGRRAEVDQREPRLGVTLDQR